MKVVVAVDSLKGSLTSMEAGNAVREGIRRVNPEAQVVVKPLADGGEGTTEAFIEGLSAERVTLIVTGPESRAVKAVYGWIKETKTAVMEIAAAAGITLLRKEEKQPFAATTRGVGEMILDAATRGCRTFIIGIGGSATNDGGIGMLKALGYKFTNETGEDAGEGSQALSRVSRISDKNVSPLLSGCSFLVACDVTNPLCGQNGATYVYGPQKGIEVDELEQTDKAMASFAGITARQFGQDLQNEEGAGAAGGLGFAFISYLNAGLVPGVELVLDTLGLEKELCDADIFVTGEGRLDHQSAMGKAPVGAARLAKKHGVPVLAFAGGVTKGASACNEAGIDAFFPIVRGVTTLREAMESKTAAENMSDSVEQAFRLIQAIR